jgi:ectoine hydroxylase-related dioxygenase (phytanoyl-CoA dioxygenase family)
VLRRVKGYLQFREDENAPEESRQLEQQGFCVIRNALSKVELSALSTEIEIAFDELPCDQRAGDQRSGAEDECFRYEMLNRSANCQTVINHARTRSVLAPLLGHDFHLIANTAWRNPPTRDDQHAGQAWHIDAGPHVPLPEGIEWPHDIPHPVFAVGAHIYLKDCALEDGPTGVIPGSHLSGQFPPLGRLLDDDLEYQGIGTEPLLAKAGDIAMFVSDIWHRRLPTQPGDHGRFFLQAHYGRRDIAQRLQTTKQSNQLSEAAIQRASSPEEKTIIGLHSPMFYDS